jgi:hypothetical protein
MTDLPCPATLAATALIDSDHPDVIALARQHAQGATDRERAVSLYLAVRDRFRYDPYRIDLSPQGMRASAVIAQGSGWCVPKAALMVPETKRPALESDVSQLSLSPTTTVPESLVMELKATVLVMTSAITMSKVSTAVKPAASVRVTVTVVVPADAIALARTVIASSAFLPYVKVKPTK